MFKFSYFLFAGRPRIHRRLHLSADAKQRNEPATQRRNVPQTHRGLGLTTTMNK